MRPRSNVVKSVLFLVGSDFGVISIPYLWQRLPCSFLVSKASFVILYKVKVKNSVAESEPVEPTLF